MRRARMTAVAAIAASGVVGIGLAATGTAHAGTKGQQVRVCATTPHGGYRQVTLSGKNQEDADATVTNLFGPGCTPISGFWWNGDVNIRLSNSNSGYADHNEICEVPESQLTSDWFECRVTVNPAVAP